MSQKIEKEQIDASLLSMFTERENALTLDSSLHDLNNTKYVAVKSGGGLAGDPASSELIVPSLKDVQVWSFTDDGGVDRLNPAFQQIPRVDNSYFWYKARYFQASSYYSFWEHSASSSETIRKSYTDADGTMHFVGTKVDLYIKIMYVLNFAVKLVTTGLSSPHFDFNSIKYASHVSKNNNVDAFYRTIMELYIPNVTVSSNATMAVQIAPRSTNVPVVVNGTYVAGSVVDYIVDVQSIILEP